MDITWALTTTFQELSHNCRFDEHNYFSNDDEQMSGSNKK
jgi:hypothetical protein